MNGWTVARSNCNVCFVYKQECRRWLQCIWIPCLWHAESRVHIAKQLDIDNHSEMCGQLSIMKWVLIPNPTNHVNVICIAFHQVHAKIHVEGKKYAIQDLYIDLKAIMAKISLKIRNVGLSFSTKIKPIERSRNLTFAHCMIK